MTKNYISQLLKSVWITFFIVYCLLVLIWGLYFMSKQSEIMVDEMLKIDPSNPDTFLTEK